MQSKEIKRRLIETVHAKVAGSQTTTRYRTPLVGFASADDPRFNELKKILPEHLAPNDLLPGAKSVAAFFIPFSEDIVEANSLDPEKVSPVWVTAYLETNRLINQICEKIVDDLSAIGVRAATQPATHNFNPETLSCHWSHKSVAVICGLGSFGLNRMLITAQGCAGRIGSLVLDAAIDPSPPLESDYCLYYAAGACAECVDLCPIGALDENNGIDKPACHARLKKNAEHVSNEGLADVCGKCAMGRCALQNAAD